MEKGSAIERTGDVDLRVRHSKEVVMATTYELLSEEGLAGVTVDAVARRSGVAKTTIYRHWPSREALLLDACAQMGPHFDIPDAGSFPNDLRALAQRVVDQRVHDARDFVRQRRISQRRNREHDSGHEQRRRESRAEPVEQPISHVGFVEQIAFHFSCKSHFCSSETSESPSGARRCR